MLLALTQLSAGWQALLYGLATLCWLLAALKVGLPRVNLVAAGLALFGFVFFLNALART